MTTQWPLVLFTFFVCLSCGIFGALGFLAIKGKAKEYAMVGTVASLVTLAVGGIAVFFHLQHWDRIFNGFGHITSGITHELIGCVVLGILMIIWLVYAAKKIEVPAWLGWVTIIAAIAMVAVTGHSYMMPARPGWGIDLVIYYLCNAFAMGTIALWAFGSMKKDAAITKQGVNYTFIGSLVLAAGMLIYACLTAVSKVANYTYYADPTQMTTAPTHVDSLMNVMVSGDGAAMFWVSIICAVIAIACAFLAKKKDDNAAGMMAVIAIAVLVASITFRVLFYVLGFSLFTLY